MHRIIHLEETGSTNSDAMRLALSGEALPLWVAAKRQTAGRGRAGRSWVSAEGNLQASCAVLIDGALEAAGQLSLVAGISLFESVHRTLRLAPGALVRLKWPNDLLIGSAKAGGILVESTQARGEPGFLAVLGFGVNIAHPPEGLQPAATSLALHLGAGAPILKAERLLDALAEETARWVSIWDGGRNFADIRVAWIERAGDIGEPITINSGDGPVRGRYRGLTETGALMAEVDGTLRVINYGEVALGAVDSRNGAA